MGTEPASTRSPLTWGLTQPLAVPDSEHLCLLCLLTLWRPSSLLPGGLPLGIFSWPVAYACSGGPMPCDWDSGASLKLGCDCNVEVGAGCPPTCWGVAVGR